jgi:hypothetical protein
MGAGDRRGVATSGVVASRGMCELSVRDAQRQPSMVCVLAPHWP